MNGYENTVERAAMGSVLFDLNLVPILLTRGSPDLFSGDELLIFKLIEKLHSQGKEITIDIIAEILSNEIPQIYIYELPTHRVHNNLFYLEQDLIRNLNYLRSEKLGKEFISKTESIVKSGRPYINVAEDLQKAALNHSFIETSEDDGSLESCFAEFDDYTSSSQAINFGFPTIDSAFGGFRYGELVCFMARTGVGKTFWVLNVINSLTVRLQENIAFFSLEMNRTSVLERLCQIRCSLILTEAKEKMMSDKSLRSNLIREFKRLKIYTKNYSTSEIESKIKSTASKIIFIDHLDLIRDESKKSDRYEKTSDRITEIKKIAKRQDVLIVILSQTPRTAGEGEIPIKLTMARDSGVIEEACDFIFGAWRPELGCKPGQVPEEEKNKLYLKLIKNKRGILKMIKCHFDNGGTGKIWELKKSEREKPEK